MKLQEVVGMWGTLTKVGNKWAIRGPNGGKYKIADQNQIKDMGLKKGRKVVMKMRIDTDAVDIVRELK